MEITQDLLRTLAVQLHKTVTWRGLISGGSFDEYYYTYEYTLYQDDYEPMSIVAYKRGKKILSYNGYTGNGVTWYGDEDDFDSLWKIVVDHDDIMNGL